jgi:hypothetical protein
MIKNMKMLLSFTLILSALSSFPATANSFLPLESGNNIISQSFSELTTLLTTATPSVKKGQPYDSSNDPAIKSSAGGPTEGPQHGYFAVPLIVIGLAGILLYFSKFN